MRFAPAPDHLTFFYQNHFIEFEDLLSEKNRDLLLDSSIKGLEKRCALSSEDFSKTSFKKRFEAGRDLWRDEETLKKLTFSSHLAEIAATLTKKRQLRIAYSQFLSQSAPLKDSEILPALSGKYSLQEMSSFQGIVCGLILQLSSHKHPAKCYDESESQSDPQPLSMLPERPGNGMFFLPNTPLSFELFFQNTSCHQLLIVYSLDTTMYRYEERDPNTHFLKQLGCGFGDQLKESTHPIVYNG